MSTPDHLFDVSLGSISPLFTEKLLLSIIQQVLSDSSATILNYKVSYASKPGESYLGIVYRINAVCLVLNNQEKNISLIAKGMPSNLARRATWKIPSFFRNEHLFYSHVVPILADFEKRKGKNQFHQKQNSLLHIPECLYSHSDGDNDFIILEDLQVSDFQISERMEGLNAAHIEAALGALGHFHGLSLALKFQEPDTFKKMVQVITEPYYRLDYEAWYAGFLKNLQTVVIEAISHECPNSVYEQRLRAFANQDQYNQMCELVKPSEPYAVPNHGDAWGPNFLYSYDSQDKSTPSDIRMLDFQLMRCASPVLDVLFLIYSVSTTTSRGGGGFQRMLHSYYKALTEAMTTVGTDASQIISYSNLVNELNKYGKFGLGMGIESVPLSMVETKNVCDLDAIPGSNEVPLHEYWKVPLIENKESRRRLADLVIFSVEQGFI